MKRGLRMAALTLLVTLLSGHALAFDPLPYDELPPYAPHEENFLRDNRGYRDESLSIRVETQRHYDTDIMIVYVNVADASQIRTGTCVPGKPASKSYKTVYDMVKKCYPTAVLAIDGDFFIYQDEGLKGSRGVIIRNREQIRRVFSTDRESLIIDNKGDFHIVPTTEEDFRRYEGRIIHSFWFGPGLVKDGERISDEALESIVMNIGPYKPTQRMAIGQLDSLSYVIVASEGPESKPAGAQRGLTIEEIAQICYDLGCVNAYNLDGGSSTQIVLNSSQNTRKINSPSNPKQRAIGDIIYFATLVP